MTLSHPHPGRATNTICPDLTNLRWLMVLSLVVPAIVWAADPVTDSKAAANRAVPVKVSQAYVIQLSTSDDPPRLDSLPDLAVLRQFRLYAVKAETGDEVAYRLRLGFFADMKEAQVVRDQVLSQFPGSWILKVSAEEQQKSAVLALRPEDTLVPGPQPTTTPVSLPADPVSAPATTQSSPAQDRLGSLMEEGRQAVAQGDFPRAIRIYTKVLETADSPYAQDALEYLGLARERNGQTAHAKAEYEKYLELYPKDPGAERVRQRLAGLLTAREAPRKKLPETKPAAAKTMTWNNAGSLSQYYRRDTSSIDNAGATVTQSALITDLDLSTRGRNEDYDIRARFNGGYTYDFLSDGENLSRVSSLYVDVGNRRTGLSGRLGRQTRSSGGVFGRFDGLLLGYQTNSAGKLNFVTGHPVERTTDTSINNDKTFYGISSDLPRLMENWDYSVYAITQRVDALTDRNAVGGEARFLDNTRSLLALLDYDVHFQQLNIFTLLGNWNRDEHTSYNFTLNQSRSPFLTTYNALIGQTVTQVSNLQDTYTKGQIEDLALDRTSQSRALSGGMTRTLNDRFQINADITISSLSGTPASGGVEAGEGTGNEFLYSAQFIGNSLLKQGDLAIAGLVYADASTTNTTTLTLNTRYPVNEFLRINPRLRLDFRQYEQDDRTQWITTPSIRFDYRYRRNLDFDADVGAQWSTRDTATTTEKTSGYYVYLGYNLGF